MVVAKEPFAPNSVCNSGKPMPKSRLNQIDQSVCQQGKASYDPCMNADQIWSGLKQFDIKRC